MNSQNITNLLDPTTAQMAATKNYVDTRAPFKTAVINVGSWTNGATEINVTSVSGFVTSATKSTSVTDAR